MLTRVVASIALTTALGAALAQPEFACQLPTSPVSNETPAQPPPPVPQDPLGRTSPYDTVTNFLRASGKEDSASIAEYLDSRKSLRHRQELARTLVGVMNAGLNLDVNSLSRKPEGNLADGLPPNRDLVGEALIGGHSLSIYLDRVQRQNKPPLWLFSAETLRDLPGFAEKTAHEAVEATWIERSLPEWMVETEIWGIALYRWVSTPLILGMLLALAWAAAWVLLRLYGRIFRTPIQKNALLHGSKLTAPFRLLLFGSLMSAAARFGVTLMARVFWSNLANILILIALAWLVLRVIDFTSQGLMTHFRRLDLQYRIAGIQLFGAAAKGLTIIIAALAILRIKGFDLTTAVAGLGIGGLALAFAAQKTIENLFGTVMLIADQPVRVGDFCRVGETLGTIETIGIRSSRIRTLGRTVVSVPNGQVASMVLENFAQRDKVWFQHTIGLRYETTADQLRYVLATIRTMLYAHPKVESTSARIRFVRFGGSSLDLEIFAYIVVLDYSVFLQIQEDLLLRIMDIIEASGTGIAFPSQTTYLAKDGGLDSEKSKTAIATVKQWREEQTLPFPDHSSKIKSDIENSLEYPPPESAARNEK